MMNEWKEHELGEFASIQTGPFGSQLHASDYVPIGVPSIMPKNIGSRLNIVTSDIARIRECDAHRLTKYRVKPTDIVYSRRGDVEKCAFVTDEHDGWLCGTGCIRVRFISDRVDPRFIALSLSTAEVRGWISGNAVGTIMPNLNTGILQKVPLLLPSIAEQRAIAAVLNSLDDKIDLLHRQNKTLEAIAETLFRQWFIEEAIDDWEEGILGDYVTVGIGRTPPRQEFHWFSKSVSDVKWVSIKDLADSGVFVFRTAEYLTRDAVDTFSIPEIPPNTVLLSFKMTVGRVAITTESMLSNEAIAHFKIPPGCPLCTEYLYFHLKLFQYDLLGTTSSIVTSINSRMIRDMPIRVPPSDKLKRFQKRVTSLFAKIRFNQCAMQNLEKLRDTLLPKLLSGEVRVHYE